VLSMHASEGERHRIEDRERWPFLTIGTAVSLLGSVPLIFGLGALAFVYWLPFLAVLAVLISVYLFCLSTLWFGHYALEALAAERQAALPDYRMRPAADQA